MSPALQFTLSLLVGVLTGILSGMFGIGGAVISTPAIRALGATALQAIGSTLPSILPSSIVGFAALSARELDLVAASCCGSLCSACPHRSAVPHCQASSLATVMLLMVLTAGARRVHGVSHRVPDRTHPRTLEPRTQQRVVASSRSSGSRPARFPGCSASAAASSWFPRSRPGSACRCSETIATSLACVGIFAIPGTITHGISGTSTGRSRSPLAIGAIPGARIGAHFTINAGDRMLRLTVGAALGVIALIYGDRRGTRVGLVTRSPNTSSSIVGVKRPVNVFCWLG